MIPKKTVVFFFLILSINAFSQSNIDSLISISKTQKNIDLLHTHLKIAEIFGYGENGDTTIYYASLCHEQALELNDSTALLKATLFWSSGLFSKKEFQASIEKTDEIFQLAKKLNSQKEIVQGLYLKAKCYQRLHQYEQAIKIYQNAYNHSMKILIQEENEHIGEYCKAILKQMTYCYWYATKTSEGINYFLSIIKDNPKASTNIKRGYYSNIAFLYNRNSKLKEAEYYLLKAYKISLASKNWKDQFQDLAYLGVLYTAKGEHRKAIKHYQEALLLAKSNNDLNKTSYLTSNLGECYEYIGDLKAGVSLLYDGISLYHTSNDSIGIAMGYQQLGYLMFKWNNFNDAKKYYQKSLNCYENLNVEIKIAKLNLDLAISYMHTNEKDSSLHYVQVTESLLPKCEDQKLLINYNIYKAQSELKFNSSPKKALKYALKAQQLADENNLKPNSSISKLAISECYMKMGNIKLAKQYALLSWQNFKSMNRLNDKSHAAKSLSTIYKILQQTDSAYYYLSEAEKINSKIRERDQTLALYKKDSEFTTLLANNEKKLLVKENKRLFNRISFIRIFYISLCILLSGCLLLYLTRKTRRFKVEIHQKELAKKKLIETSKQHKLTLQQSNQIIQEKKEIIDELNTKLQSNNDSEINNKELIEIDYLLNSKLSTEEDWDEYLTLFTQRHPSFISELKNRYQQLSRNEIKIFVLTKLKLTTREMAGILMISPSSVNTARYRLRKKINLDSSTKLEDTVAKID